MEKAHPKIRIRRWKESDIPKIGEIQQAAYSGFPTGDLCDERLYRIQLNAFPDGQLLAEADGDMDSVRPLMDRRPDIYELKSRRPVDIIRV